MRVAVSSAISAEYQQADDIHDETAQADPKDEKRVLNRLRLKLLIIEKVVQIGDEPGWIFRSTRESESRREPEEKQRLLKNLKFCVNSCGYLPL